MIITNFCFEACTFQTNIGLLKGSKQVYRSFVDGLLINDLELNGPFILLRVYLDAFTSNNPVGSASGVHKIMGFYLSGLVDLKVCSKRCTIQTISLILQKDITHFGLNICLKRPISELKSLVQEGIFDEISNRNIQVRVIASLGLCISG